MSTSTSPISQSALEILSQITVSENTDNWSVKLTCGQLNRQLYDEIDEVLKRLRGKWHGQMKAHLFPYDPTALICGVVETAIMPPKNPLAFFATPNDLVAAMLEIASSLLVWKEADQPVRILEPSAGQGAIADGIKLYFQEVSRYDGAAIRFELSLVELDPLSCRMLEYKGYEVKHTDFLSYQPEEGYDLILMNPPFAVEGDKQAYITHINHAWELLKPEGRLIAITPTSFLQNCDHQSREFLKLVATYGTHSRNGKERFRESGTNIDTCLVVLDKNDISWRRQPKHGEGSFSWHLWALLLHFDNNEQSYLAKAQLIKAILAGQYGQIYSSSDGELLPQVKEAIRQLYTPSIRAAHLLNDGVDPDTNDWQTLFGYFAEQIAEYRNYCNR